MPALGISRVNRLVKAPQQFELEHERPGRHSELAAIGRDHRRAPDVGSDDFFASRDGLRRYCITGFIHCGLRNLSTF
jgi:hypothetical protein